MISWHGEPPPRGSLVDILDRVLDKGLVVAGDIRVALANVELLTIKVRLLICSVEKAQEIGLDWWRQDGFLSTEAEEQRARIEARVEALEQQLARASQPEAPARGPGRPRPRAGRRRQRE